MKCKTFLDRDYPVCRVLVFKQYFGTGISALSFIPVHRFLYEYFGTSISTSGLIAVLWY